MTREEKLRINRDRQKAVRDAWARERNLVEMGKGTVDWTPAQQKELLETGHVKGFEGQHMKSVNEYPEYASSVDNIQLLSHEDHLAAHGCGIRKEMSGYQNPTNGYYNPETGKMTSFGDSPPRQPEVFELSNPREVSQNRTPSWKDRDSPSRSMDNHTVGKTYVERGM